MSIYLSASSIADFIKCPQKVKFRLDKSVQVASKEMQRGTLMHEVFEKHWDSSTKAFEAMHIGAEKLGFDGSDINRMQGQLNYFFETFGSNLSYTDLIEYHFKIPLHDGVFIVGKIDRIHEGNIYDWKTGRVATRLSSDVQCIIYEYAYQSLFKRDPVSVNLVDLALPGVISYNRSQIYVDELFDNIIPRMIKTIKNEGYEKLGLFNHSCFRCPYRQVCLWKGEENELDNSVSPE